MKTSDDHDFYSHFFGGVNDYLTSADPSDAAVFLSHCARRCNESYPLAQYQTAFSGSASLDDALETLKNLFDDFDYRIFADKIDIIYRTCSCDLVRDKLIFSPNLCQCSKESLRQNFGEIFGLDHVNVTCVRSILNGDDHCLFEVRIRSLGHYFC